VSQRKWGIGKKRDTKNRIVDTRKKRGEKGEREKRIADMREREISGDLHMRGRMCMSVYDLARAPQHRQIYRLLLQIYCHSLAEMFWKYFGNMAHTQSCLQIAKYGWARLQVLALAHYHENYTSLLRKYCG